MSYGGKKLTIVCLCHNHAPFIEECLNSVSNQITEDYQVILVDDGSTDGSKALLKRFSEKHKCDYIDIPYPVGNCKAFNQALPLAKGDFILDLSTDDMLEEGVLSGWVEFFGQLPNNVGFVYSNAKYIDRNGNFIRYHFEINDLVKVEKPSGDLFARLFEGSFICPPSVLFRTSVLKELGGYDESLSFEDFDIWMRIARHYFVRYYNAVVIKKRKIRGSVSYNQLRDKAHQYLTSVETILDKAMWMAKTPSELVSISVFASYHLKLAFLNGELVIVNRLYEIISRTRETTYCEKGMLFLSKCKLHPRLIYRTMLTLRWWWGNK